MRADRETPEPASKKDECPCRAACESCQTTWHLRVSKSAAAFGDLVLPSGVVLNHRAYFHRNDGK
jgi:hypothetical protein